jgi:crotonobetainyl-CoA:carnitine CoA-transferase CaiB-like acyl-CoA transferase
MALPLEGIRILESALQYPGPYCGMLLADLGAEVIKIERPGTGDPARHLPHFFRSINRNKKSLTLNMKIPGARQILYRLAARSDVFTEGSRPGVATRLGVDYDALSKINPRLVYCSISGYGQQGPYRDLPGHDLNYQAMSGMLQCFRDKEDNLVRPKLAIGDLSSGMFAALGILAALMGREKSGKGQYVDVSMFDGLLSWMSTHFGIFFGTGQSQRPYDAGYGIFRGRDGKAFTLGIAHEDWFWDRLCVALGLGALQGISGPERRERRDELIKTLQGVFSQKSGEEWLRILKKADVPAAPVNTLEEVVQDPHVAFRQMIQEVPLSSGERHRQIGFPIKLSHVTSPVRMPVPELGEHTEEILKEMGYADADIRAFAAEGVI